MSQRGRGIPWRSRLWRQARRMLHPVYRMARVARVHDAWARIRLARSPMVRHHGHPFLLNPRDEGVSIRFKKVGSFDAPLVALACRQLRPGAVALDVGANIGVFTLPMAKAVGPAGAVHAFEPSRENLAFLEANLRLAGAANVHVHPVALGDRDGEATLFHWGRNRGGHSLALANVPDPSGEERVRTARLDSWARANRLGRLDLVKMDVQGAEGLVLAGGTELLRRFRPVLLMEFQGDAYRAFGRDPAADLGMLEAWGYSFEVLPDHLGNHPGPCTAAQLAALEGRREVNVLATCAAS